MKKKLSLLITASTLVAGMLAGCSAGGKNASKRMNLRLE